MRILLISAIIFLQTNSAMGSGQTHCLSRHIKEALQVNETRAARYESEAGKKAAKAFKRLMFFERLMIPFTSIWDKRAVKFQKKGSTLFCHDVVSMDETPEFLARKAPPIKPNTKSPIIKKIKKSIKEAWDRGSYGSPYGPGPHHQGFGRTVPRNLLPYKALSRISGAHGLAGRRCHSQGPS